jgi:hypothetical protein
VSPQVRRSVLAGFALLAVSCSGAGVGAGGGAGASWSAPSYIPPPAAASMAWSEVRVGVASTGAGMLFWSTYTGATTEYNYSRYAPASGWGAAVVFSPGTAVYQTPELGMQGDGEAVLAWPSAGAVSVARAPSGGDFGAPVDVGPATSPRGLQLQVRPTGHAVVGWTQNDGNGVPHAWASVYAPGGAWSTAALVDASVYGLNPGSLRVAADGLGGAFAVWSEQDVGAGGVWAARYAAATGWDAPLLLDTSSFSSAQPEIAASRDGRAVAAWMQPDATGLLQQVYTRRFDPASGWSAAVLLMSSVTATGYSVPYPRVAMNDGGAALAVWRELDRTTVELTAVGSGATAGAWATPVQLEGPLGSSSPSLDSWLTPALAGSGDGVAIWCDYAQVQTRRYHAGGSWGALVPLSSGTYVAGEPRIAMNASGQAIAAWTEILSAATDRVAVATFSGF